MITPTSFAIHVTYTCPLTCAHCCFSSSMQNHDSLPVGHILDTIAQLDTSVIQMVAFTGGEPFLLGKGLIDIVAAASRRAFTTRVVTSAYFGRSRAVASRRLKQLAEAGLDELSISWDDFHEEFVDFDCVRNVFWAAKDLGLVAAVNTVQGAQPRWTAGRVRSELGLADDSPDVILESSLNLTGRAAEELQDAGLRSVRTLGPCPYVLTGPTLSAKNKLLACCGVIPETDYLVLDHDFRPENLDAGIHRGLQSPLLNWIHLRGPYAVMEWISQRYGIQIPARETIGGNCEACRLLFETREVAARIPDALRERAVEIFDELNLLESLGWSEPKAIMKLWYSTSTIVDTVAAPPS